MVKRSGGWLRRGAGWAAAGLFVVASAHIAAAVSYYPPTPSGTLGISRPAIRQQFMLSEGESITGVAMELDEQPVAARWDQTGLITYTPADALAAGRHTVRLSVSVADHAQGIAYDPAVSEVAFTVGPDAVAQFPAPGPEEQRALDVINGYRNAAGVAPLTYAADLGAAALSHAQYLAANPGQRERSPHEEQAGTAFFTGATVGDRAQHFGYTPGLHEVINFQDRAEVAVDGWMETLYHRIPLIHPDSFEMGYGLAGSGNVRLNVLEAGMRQGASGSVAWPYSGQTGVPTAWDGAETPDPFALHPGSQKPAGYPITLTFGGRPSALSLRTGTLTGPEGAVSVLRFDPDSDPNLADTVALIPREPLQPGVRYTVAMAGSITLGNRTAPFERQWSFTTAGAERPRMTGRTNNISANGMIESITVEGSGFAPGMKLFLDGLPVEELAVGQRSTLAFRAPLGYGGGAADLVAVAPDGSETVWPRFLAGDERVYTPDAGLPFTQMPLLINGRAWSGPALVQRSGALLVPGDLLEAFGGRRTAVPEIGREYWTVRGNSLDYTLGRTAASLNGKAVSLAVPVRASDGRTYVDAALLVRATGMGVRVGAQRVDFGLLDIDGHWARSQILQLVDAGVIGGMGDGRFRPDEPLSRAAFVKMLIASRGLAPQPGAVGGLSDAGRHWVGQQGYIGAALRAGIIVAGEYPGGRFEPERPITRGEMGVMIGRALAADKQSPGVAGGATVLDGPGQNATRAEAAVVLARVMAQH